jgi:hypothetical protein
MAAQMPDPPVFSVSDRSGSTADLRARREQIMRPAANVAIEAPTGANGTQPANASGGEAAAAAVATTKPAPKAATVESTQVVVVGLVSVASIATFKRQLGRLPGVKSVGVSSGPDGEFIFTVGHNSDTSLSSLIPTLPTFQARVVSEREGVLNVSAHDPEAEG